jgi:anti-sigma regulatory factor (Ser/Thr protein kinase)
LIPEILARFDGQALPEAFFKFYDYYEAAGRLDPRRRVEAMLESRQTLIVPETVGVSGGGGSVLGGRPAEFQARAFRGGNYQRYAEELWIALDLSATRALTTPEIQRAIERAARERKRTGIENGRLWLIVGETVSADGLELLRSEKVFCSNLEQLALLRERIAEETAGRRDEAARGREAAAAEPAAQPESRPRPVIDLGPGREPRGETTTLRLPAREESEYIAALMAEKVAIRADFGATEAGKIKTAVLEGTLNAIEHSPNPEKMIDVRFILSPESMEIVVENEGAHFDPAAVQPPDPKIKLAAGNKRGWGITLMKKFMDEVEYEPCNGGTRLRLIKRRARARAAAAGEKEAEADARRKRRV